MAAIHLLTPSRLLHPSLTITTELVGGNQPRKSHLGSDLRRRTVKISTRPKQLADLLESLARTVAVALRIDYYFPG
jgi:hypothetical protein